MQINIHTDHNINGHQDLSVEISGVVEHALSRFRDHITRVQVHLSDVNGDKRGQNDMRCMMEARIQGRHPIAVTHRAASLDQAVDGAANKLTRLVKNILGRQRDQENDRTDPPRPDAEPEK
ncbi:HPF/RaiA family ribosome-associated protein [bacterium]|nr:HPF/RaiA family ribosome-associated protein [candidate division CSSED10-310 bacterium]